MAVLMVKVGGAGMVPVRGGGATGAVIHRREAVPRGTQSQGHGVDVLVLLEADWGWRPFTQFHSGCTATLDPPEKGESSLHSRCKQMC